MGSGEYSRRSFLERSIAGAGAAWLAAGWPEMLAAKQHAQHTLRAVSAGAPARFEYLTASQAADVEAISALIIPTTATPGAREAGVVYFIDRALHTFAADQRKQFADAVGVVDAKRKELFPASAGFAYLTTAQQTEILKAIEKSPEFGTLRFATVCGFLCNPEDGGNRDMAGWKQIGFDAAPTHTPPFGYYDAEYLAEKAATRQKMKP